MCYIRCTWCSAAVLVYQMSRRTIWLRDVYWIWTRYPFDLQLHLVDFCGIPCGVDSCCFLWSYTVNGGCCAPKVVEVGIIQPKHDGHQSCGILSCHSAACFFNVVTFYEIWWKSNILWDSETQFGRVTNFPYGAAMSLSQQDPKKQRTTLWSEN